MHGINERYRRNKLHEAKKRLVFPLGKLLGRNLITSGTERILWGVPSLGRELKKTMRYQWAERGSQDREGPGVRSTRQDKIVEGLTWRSEKPDGID